MIFMTIAIIICLGLMEKLMAGIFTFLCSFKTLASYSFVGYIIKNHPHTLSAVLVSLQIMGVGF